MRTCKCGKLPNFLKRGSWIRLECECGQRTLFCTKKETAEEHWEAEKIARSAADRASVLRPHPSWSGTKKPNWKVALVSGRSGDCLIDGSFYGAVYTTGKVVN